MPKSLMHLCDTSRERGDSFETFCGERGEVMTLRLADTDCVACRALLGLAVALHEFKPIENGHHRA
jgi:hypothetical protein